MKLIYRETGEELTSAEYADLLTEIRDFVENDCSFEEFIKGINREDTEESHVELLNKYSDFVQGQKSDMIKILVEEVE